MSHSHAQPTRRLPRRPSLLGRAAAAFLAALAVIAPLAPAAAAPGVDVAAELRTARDLVQQSLRDYAAGDKDAAFRNARSAYLDHFEYAEPPLRVLNPDLILETEYQFADLRNGMRDGLDMSVVRATAVKIDRALNEAEVIVSGTGVLAPALAATGGFTILFREGLEAALLVAALIAYLESTRNDRLKRPVVLGALAAGVATALTWVAASFLVQITPVSRELLEAVTSVIAVAILFYLSFWMLQQSDRRRHMEFMRARVSQAVMSGSGLAVAGIAFTTVYREGFETVLFYQALAAASGPVITYMYAGVAAAVVAIAAAVFVIFRLQRRLPTHAIFQVTVAITAILAVAFVGNGLRGFQEAGWIPTTNLIGVLPRLHPTVASLTGLHPTLETLVGQAILAAVYIAGLIAFRITQARARHTSDAAPAAAHD